MRWYRASLLNERLNSAGKRGECERNSMRKLISEMTPADKASFLEATKRALLIEC